MKHWMDIDELADYLKMSKRVIYEISRKGKIPCYRINRRLRFERQEIDDWMDLKKQPLSNPDIAAQSILSAKKQREEVVDDVIRNAVEFSQGKGRKNKPSRGN